MIPTSETLHIFVTFMFFYRNYTSSLEGNPQVAWIHIDLDSPTAFEFVDAYEL